MIEPRGGRGGSEGGRARRAALTLLLVGAAACGGGKAASGSGGSSGTMPGIGSTNGMGSDGGTSKLAVDRAVGGPGERSGGHRALGRRPGTNRGHHSSGRDGDTTFDAMQAPAKMRCRMRPRTQRPRGVGVGRGRVVAGDAVVIAGVTTSGGDAVRKISASGDLYLTGLYGPAISAPAAKGSTSRRAGPSMSAVPSTPAATRDRTKQAGPFIWRGTRWSSPASSPRRRRRGPARRRGRRDHRSDQG